MRSSSTYDDFDSSVVPPSKLVRADDSGAEGIRRTGFAAAAGTAAPPDHAEVAPAAPVACATLVQPHATWASAQMGGAVLRAAWASAAPALTLRDGPRWWCPSLGRALVPRSRGGEVGNPRGLPVIVVRELRGGSTGGVPEFGVFSSELGASGQRGPAGLVVSAIWASAAPVQPPPPPRVCEAIAACATWVSAALRSPPVRRGVRPPSSPQSRRRPARRPGLCIGSAGGARRLPSSSRHRRLRDLGFSRPAVAACAT